MKKVDNESRKAGGTGQETFKAKGLEWPVNALLLLAIACLGLYVGTLHSPFIFDDFHTIVENPYLSGLKNFPAYFIKTQETINRIENEGWRPLWYLSFILNFTTCGLNTFCYHITNIIIHFADCALVYLLAFLLLKDRADKPWLAALMAALLFAVNPVQTESVSYIVSRSASMAAFFYAAAFYFHVVYREKNRAVFGVACGIAFVLGMLSKENAVSFPLMALAYELLVKREGKKPVFYLALLFALAAAFTAVRFYFIGLGEAPAAARGFLGHWITEVYVLMLYVLKSLLPFNLNLDPDVRALSGIGSPLFWASLAALCLLAWGLYKLYRRDRLAGFLGLWFFIALIPETVMPITDFYAEHRLYLPLTGPALLAGYSLERFITAERFRKYRYAGWALAISVLALMAAGTFQRNKVYATESSVWADTVRKSPNKARPRIGAALALKHYGKKEAAYEEFKNALALEPDNGIVLYNIGILLCEMNRYNEALHYAREAVRVLPDYYNLNGLGVVYAKLGMNKEARRTLLDAIALKPDFYSSYLNLGTLDLLEGRPEESLVNFRKAAALRPFNIDAHRNASSALISLKRYNEAAVEAGKALELWPDYGSAWNMAKALEGSGDLKGAARYYSLYLKLAPKDLPERKEAEDKARR